MKNKLERGICCWLELALACLSLTALNTACNSKNDSTTGLPNTRPRATLENNELKRLPEKISVLTISRDGKVVLVSGTSREVAASAISNVENGKAISVIGISDGQYIEINGLKVESGLVEIQGHVPRFVTSGALILDKFCKHKDDWVNIRAEVHVTQPTRGEFIRVALPDIKEAEAKALRCYSDIDGQPIEIAFDGKSGRPGDTEASVSSLLKGVIIKITAVRIPDDIGQMGVGLCVFSRLESPPGFRFALTLPDAFGKRVGPLLAFRDRELAKD